MKVFVITSADRDSDDSFHVEAVRSTLELAEAYVRSRGEVQEWCVDGSADEGSLDTEATAYVRILNCHLSLDYVFIVRSYDLA